MENRKRLYRRCAERCNRILPAVTWEESLTLTEEELDNTVRWTTDPFAEEIHGDFTKMWICGSCEHESAMDI